MLDPARYALLDTPKPLTWRLHRNRRRTSKIFIAERPRSDHPIDTQLVDLNFRSARVSVNTQEDRVDIGFAKIDIRAEQASEKALTILDKIPHIADRRGRPASGSIVRGSKNHFGQGRMRRWVPGAREHHPHTDTNAGLRASNANRRLELRDDRAGLNRGNQVNEGSVTMGILDRLDSRLDSIRCPHHGASIISPKNESSRTLVERIEMLCQNRLGQLKNPKDQEGCLDRKSPWNDPPQASRTNRTWLELCDRKIMDRLKKHKHRLSGRIPLTQLLLLSRLGEIL